jgi:predicted nucleic acid-binding protein
MTQMNEKVFVDTNILVYLYSEDDLEKRDIARTPIDKYNCVVSTQVLNEFSNVSIKKFKKTSEEIELAIDEIIEQFSVVFINEQTVKHALKIHAKYRYGYFDSLMIVSALNSDCKYLFTEDLTDDQIIENKLKIINIFKNTNY